MSMDKELGIDRQREDCLPYCEAKGWEPVEYIDLDRSAASGALREGYEQMLADVEAGTIQAVVAWDLDRLHRRPAELERFMDIAEKHGIALATMYGDVDISTPQGQLLARMKGAVARHEVDQMKVRQARAFKQIADSGRGWGAPCFGYGSDHRNPYVVPEEAAAIRQAYKDLLAGSTLYSIAKSLNEQGFHTRPRSDRPKGNPWQGTTIRRLLQNPRMAGFRSHKGEIVGKGDWEPIVDEATWEQANHILSDPKRRKNAATVRKYLLGGILRCGTCSQGLRSASGRSGKGTVAIYRCKNEACVQGVIRNQDRLDGWVRDLVIKRLSKRDWMPPGAVLSIEEARELHEEASGLVTRIDGLAEDYADGTLDKRAYQIAKERLEGKLEAVGAQISRAARSHVFDGLVGLSDPAKVAKMFDDMPVDRQRSLLEGLFEKIVVHPLGVTGWNVRKIPVGTAIDVHWNVADTACVAKKFKPDRQAPAR
jgi:DNA invertase Pin-like site-specific DNA recombinase